MKNEHRKAFTGLKRMDEILANTNRNQQLANMRFLISRYGFSVEELFANTVIPGPSRQGSTKI